MESILLIFKRPIREILDELDCALKSVGQSGGNHVTNVI